jgi:hypothetical protein
MEETLSRGSPMEETLSRGSPMEETLSRGSPMEETLSRIIMAYCMDKQRSSSIPVTKVVMNVDSSAFTWFYVCSGI